MSYCSVSECIVSYYTLSYCIASHCIIIVLHCFVSHCIAFYCIIMDLCVPVLYLIVWYCIVLRCIVSYCVNAWAYPKCVVKESIDDGIDEAVGHRQPVYHHEDGESSVVRIPILFKELCLRSLRCPGVILVCQWNSVEVLVDVEEMQRQPTDAKHSHHRHEHLHDLNRSHRWGLW